MWSRILEGYRSSDPAAWIGVYKAIPWGAGLVIVAVGIFLLLLGGGRAFRLVAAPLGAIAGFLWAPALVRRFGIAAPPELAVWIAAAGIGSTSFVIPHVALFFVFGVPAGFAGGSLAGDDHWALGFVLGLLVGGTIGAVLTRIISGAIASAIGAWLLMIGGLAALRPWVGWTEALGRRPWAVFLIGGLIAVAGTLYQLYVRPVSFNRQLRADTARARKEAEDRLQ